MDNVEKNNLEKKVKVKVKIKVDFLIFAKIYIIIK